MKGERTEVRRWRMRWGMSAWIVDGDPIGRDESPEVLEAWDSAIEDFVGDLRSLIQSLNPQEVDTNAG